MNTTITVYTKKNTKLNLSLIGSGGEGSVYEIVGYPQKVAKIYHPDSVDVMNNREAKIDAMVAMRESSEFKNANLEKDIAWPLSPLYDDHMKFIGFGMNRISAKTELDDLYAYPPRNDLSIKDKITSLISICGIIERLHRANQVFGDFNPNNIKINPDCSACFVDVDSYHINRAGTEYRCIACAPGYVAPEVIRACHGTTYADCPGTTFTQASDRFSLAIHIFRMLMNGCHPYGCERHMKRAGSAPAPKPLDKRVENGETPFFTPVPNVVPPAYAPDINDLPPYIRDLFRKAFVDGHRDPAARPAIAEWRKALIRYQGELTYCGNNHSHYYWKRVSSCPYCAADRRYSAKNGIKVPQPAVVAPAIQTNSNNNVVYNGNTYQPKQATSTVTVAPRVVNRSSIILFWTTTLISTIAIQLLLAIYLLPNIYSRIYDEEYLTVIGVYGSAFAGVIGSIIYNCMLAPGIHTGKHAWWEYCLSILTAIGFTIGFGIVMGLLIVILQILFYIIVGIIVIAIFVGLLTGG